MGICIIILLFEGVWHDWEAEGAAYWVQREISTLDLR